VKDGLDICDLLETHVPADKEQYVLLDDLKSFLEFFLLCKNILTLKLILLLVFTLFLDVSSSYARELA